MTTKSQCISTQIDQHLSQWIYTQFEGGGSNSISPVKFDWLNLTGQIGGNGQMPLTGNVISMDLHPIRLVKFDRALITGHIGRIGCKSIEIDAG